MSPGGETMPRDAGETELLIMAWTKAAIAVLLVGAGCYCLITGVPLPDHVLEVGLLVLGAYFGFSAKVYRDSQQNGKAVAAWIRSTRRPK